MKIRILLFTIIVFLFACTDSGKSAKNADVKDTITVQRFFPLTNYLKGEIYNIKNSGINPLKYTTVNDQTDSVWLKIEQLDSTLSAFLKPEIDSANLTALFTEKNFMDQSLNAVTFTYDPSGSLPDSMTLRHWDVYIDPKSSKVKRVYIVKQIDKNNILQLTWVSGQWCKTTSITTDDKGMMKVAKEEKLIWDF
jgi:hypothetical protein